MDSDAQERVLVEHRMDTFPCPASVQDSDHYEGSGHMLLRSHISCLLTPAARAPLWRAKPTELQSRPGCARIPLWALTSVDSLESRQQAGFFEQESSCLNGSVHPFPTWPGVITSPVTLLLLRWISPS